MPRSKKQKGWGTLGGGRQHTPARSAKQVSRRQMREETARVQQSMEEARKAREALERRIAQEAANPTTGRVSGATWAAQQREQEAERLARLAKAPKPKHVRLGLPDPDAQGNGVWTMGQARSMLREGYHRYHVQRVTGWGENWLDDMKVDPDGYGLPIE